MMPDRTTLLIACALASAPLIRLSGPVHEMLGLVYALRALTAHRRDIRLQRQQRQR